MDDRALDTLRDLLRCGGTVAASDPVMVSDAFNGSHGDLRCEARLLANASSLSIPMTLSILAGKEPLEGLIPRLASRLTQKFDVSESDAVWAVSAWAKAMGHQVPPGLVIPIASSTPTEGPLSATPLLPPCEVQASCAPALPTSHSVEFLDPTLENAVRDAIGKPFGPIPTASLDALEHLDLPSSGIEALDGLEHCRNLKRLNLKRNRICSIAQLRFLPHLAQVDISDNSVVDISPVSGLSSLRILDIRRNRVSNIVPLLRCSERNGLRNGGTVFLSGNPLSRDAQEVHFHILQARNIQAVITEF